MNVYRHIESGARGVIREDTIKTLRAANFKKFGDVEYTSVYSGSLEPLTGIEAVYPGCQIAVNPHARKLVRDVFSNSVVLSDLEGENALFCTFEELLSNNWTIWEETPNDTLHDEISDFINENPERVTYTQENGEYVSLSRRDDELQEKINAFNIRLQK